MQPMLPSWVPGVASKADPQESMSCLPHSDSLASAPRFCWSSPQQLKLSPTLMPTWGPPTQLGPEVGGAITVPAHK